MGIPRRPAILRMLGHTNLFRRTIRARLERAIRKKKGIRQFIRALIRREGDGYAVVATGDDGSGIMKSMIHANGLIILPEETIEVGKEISGPLQECGECGAVLNDYADVVLLLRC